MRYAMSLFVVYFGTNRQYPHLPHHSIILGRATRNCSATSSTAKSSRRIFRSTCTRRRAPIRRSRRRVGMLLCAQPVPHLGGGQDWEKIKDAYADRILASLEKEHLVPDLRKHLVSKLIFTPLDFQDRLDAYLGSAFQFEPLLTQSAWFRPHNKSEDVEGLYFVGAGTHPGAGLPGVICSAKVLDKWIM